MRTSSSRYVLCVDVAPRFDIPLLCRRRRSCCGLCLPGEKEVDADEEGRPAADQPAVQPDGSGERDCRVPGHVAFLPPCFFRQSNPVFRETCRDCCRFMASRRPSSSTAVSVRYHTPRTDLQCPITPRGRGWRKQSRRFQKTRLF